MCTAGTCVPLSGTLRPDAAVPPDAVILAADRDQDGVADVSDNCPDVANADQGNEDGDGFGDACDLCPQLADTVATAATAQLDSDGDHIGDACDPSPGTHDTLWLFEGFHTALPAWARTPNWTLSGDKLRVTAAGNTNSDGENIVPPLPGVLDNFSVTVIVLVEGTMGSNGDHSIGIEVYDETQTKGVDCELDQGATANKIFWLIDDFNNGVNKQVTFPWTINTAYRITMTRRGSTYTCSIAGPGGALTTTSGTSAALPRSGAAVDVWAYGMTAQLLSVAIVGPS